MNELEEIYHKYHNCCEFTSNKNQVLFNDDEINQLRQNLREKEIQNLREDNLRKK